jgi:outer membrane protein assembly factor BamB
MPKAEEEAVNPLIRSARCVGATLAGLLLAAIVPIQARYSKSPFVPNAFPKPVSQRVFAIPLDPAQLLVVYPAALEPSAKKLQTELAARCGREIPFRAADSLKPDELPGRHLVILGNISDNRWALDLYKQRYAFADALFPGKGGYIIHPATSIWDRTRNVLVVGVSSEEDLVRGFESFLSLLPQGAEKIETLHALKTDLEMPGLPPNAARLLDDARKNTTTAGAPYGAVGQWGLNYFLTGDKAWAELFRQGFAVFYERAEKSGDWVPEAWTNIYFSLRGLFLAWDLLDDDPFFTGQDRRLIEETLWGFTTFVRNMILLDKNIASMGEPRQNHTSHMGFGLYYAYRYYTQKYAITGLEPMAEQFRLDFDLGQANSYRPNDDAAGYQFATPGDYYAYAMAQGDESALKKDKLREYMDLLVATTDNHGETVSFGDVGSYSPRERGGGRSPAAHFARLAAWYYGDGQYQWFANWLSGPRSPGNLANGDYAADIRPEPPTRYSGITAVMLDESSLLFASRRAEKPSWLPAPDKRYFDKIALRRNFDPQDEYLSLEGTSFFSHGHLDGNTVTRLTWKDRIWLFDLHYINFTPRYHSGVSVTFEGRQDDPPLLTSLDLMADFPSTGLLQTTSGDFSRADWTRHIIWRKGRYFLFLDDVKALETGDFRIDGRWRTRGDIELKGNVLKVLQGDRAFYIKSADATPRSLVYEPDGYSSVWNYPYGNGKIGVCLARRRVPLGRGAVWSLANLMYAADAADRTSIDITRIADGLYGIRDGGARQIAGTNPGPLAKAGIVTDSALFFCDAQSLSLAGLTRLRFGDIRLDSTVPVHLDLDVLRGTGTLIVPAGCRPRIVARDLNVGPQGGREKPAFEPGSYPVSFGTAGLGAGVKLKVLTDLEETVDPDPWPSPLKTAGIAVAKRAPLTDALTSFCEDGETLLVGDEKGRVTRFHGDARDALFQVGSARPIAAIKAADINGDGTTEVIAGDDQENLFCYQPSGVLLWSYKMTPTNGSAVAADIAVGDIDGRGKPTILVATRSWKLYAFYPDGKVRWEAFLYYHPGTKVGILSGEKQPTVIASGNVYHTPLNVVWPADGRVLWHTWEQCGGEAYSTTDYCGFYLTGLVFMDTDGDGIKEIIFGTKFNRIYALNAADGATKWSALLGDEVTVIEKMADPVTGEEYILAGTDAGELVKLNRRGRRVRALTISGAITGLKVVEYPGKKRTDIIAAARDGGIVVFDQDFNIRATAALADSPTGLIPAGEKGESRRFYAVSGQAVTLLEYQPYFLRKSRDY